MTLPQEIRRGEIKLGSLTIIVSIMDNGSRIIHEESLIAFLKWLESGEIVPEAAVKEFAEKYKSL